MFRRRAPGVRGAFQGEFPFRRRSRRRRRAFKAAIVAATILAMALIVGGSPTGRYGVLMATNRVHWAARSIFGLERPREDIEAERQAARWIGVDRTRAALAETIANDGPHVRRMLEGALMAPDTALIRWGNYDGTLVLSSGVFEPDDEGRSYRFKPLTRSIWFIGLSLKGALCQFQVPDTPEAREAVGAAGGRVVPQSVQLTNSWGLRGPEPDVHAPLRGIVLGDSVIQGALVGDDETPPACLEREIAARIGMRASVLNGGVLGYSPEQYYFTLERFAGRMAPHFVVVSLCGNDFGEWADPSGWDESCYWLGRILQLCRTRQIAYLVVPWPGEDALLGDRDESVYPGQVSHRMRLAGTHYFYPVELFATEDLRIRQQWEKEGRPTNNSPLYNRRLMGDNHLSPLGCALWGRVVAERLELLLRKDAHSLWTGRRPPSEAAPSRPGAS